ncbi:MAG: glycerol dehydrogenase [Solirubrobacterales bacterium]|nr:glycerol dehydrogenase [Solirubrobacterales bacterium]
MAESNGSRPPAVFAAPLRYIQGEGALHSLGDELSRLKSERPLILVDPGVKDALAPQLESQSDATLVDFRGEVSPGEIDRVAAAAQEAGADVIVGVGGGKTLDTAKAVAHPAELALVLVPTIASTDAPTSAVSVVYEDDGGFLEYRFWGRNPDVVLIDTGVIARAPVRFLVAGIGDGLSTFFEADTSSQTRQPTMAGGPPLVAATTLARLCYDTLLADGVAARQAVEQQIVTPALDRVVEANTLLSGLGFESGGLAAAHSIHNGLTALHETHEYWHGEKVAIGVLGLLVLEGKPQALIDEVVDFCLRVGLPVTLSDIGVEADAETLGPVAELACAEGETIHNEPFPVTPAMVVAAMRSADAIGATRRRLLERTQELPVVCA